MFLVCLANYVGFNLFVLEAYDKTQGSEVKEKEKGRHQTNATN